MAPVDPLDREWRRYLQQVRSFAADDARLAVIAAVTQALARVSDWDPPPGLELARVDLSGCSAAQRVRDLDPPEALADAWLLGRVHEALLDPAERHSSGAYYTPRRIASGLTGWASEGVAMTGHTSVCDPACGGGAFLLAAADILRAQGADPAEIVRDSLWGMDLDPTAVAVTDAALSHWAWRADASMPVAPGPHLVRGNALLDGATPWTSGPGRTGFDLVVGNPPFQGQLGRPTARLPEQTAALRARFGVSVKGYTDAAALFLLAACRLARPGGRVALLQPISMFAARDTAGVRSALLARARLDGVWTAGARVFGANVRVGAVVLHVDEPVGDRQTVDDAVMSVRRAIGPVFSGRPPLSVRRAELACGESWSRLIASDTTPQVGTAATAGCLGDIATTTAGFRDQYYGLIPFVHEAPESQFDGQVPYAALVTCGLIDPACCRWGRASSRFAGHVWARPVVDVEAVRAADGTLGRWLDRVLTPKVLVACQTRVVEAVVDDAGVMVPSVPVIAVTAPRERLFDVAAVLLAPYTSAWAVDLVAGAALTADAIKLSARQVLDVPLPADRSAWSEGASLLQTSGGRLPDARVFASVMGRAYGMQDDEAVRAWWLARLPVRAGADTTRLLPGSTGSVGT